ncbi:MAG: phytanoyl-CoA dioxygenase family protein [Gammaproteobacteria bacterium]|nr:phytanoyl-CoA dioxygenase family protein [Gammaproteobacteria bacterium]
MLTPGQLQAFSDEGFLTLRGLFSAAEMREITAWLDEVAAWPEVPGRYMMYFEQSRLQPGLRILSRLEDFEPYHAGFSRLLREPRMQGIVSELFGEASVLFKDKINFKLPGGDGFKAHQDVQAGWDAYAPLHITALLTIDPCTVENGCLEVAPGFNRKGLIGEKWKPLPEDGLEYIAVPTLPGDALFFDSFAPHRSGPNITADPRRVLYVTYNKVSEGDHRRQYYADKRRSYPPDCEREPDKQYVFRV